MILTGKMLEEIGLAVWGANWADILAKKLRRATKTLYRWRDSDPPPDVREEIVAAVEDQLAIVAEYVTQLRADQTEF